MHRIKWPHHTEPRGTIIKQYGANARKAALFELTHISGFDTAGKHPGGEQKNDLKIAGLLERLAQHIGNVAGQHAFFRAIHRSQVAGYPVQEHARYSRRFRLVPLRQ